MCSGDGFREISKRDPDLELVETANTSAITDSKIHLRRVQKWDFIAGRRTILNTLPSLSLQSL